MCMCVCWNYIRFVFVITFNDFVWYESVDFINVPHHDVGKLKIAWKANGTQKKRRNNPFTRYNQHQSILSCCFNYKENIIHICMSLKNNNNIKAIIARIFTYAKLNAIRFVYHFFFTLFSLHLFINCWFFFRILSISFYRSHTAGFAVVSLFSNFFY